MLMAFWEKWYFPANAVLYIVGDVGSEVARIEALIERAFGGVPPGRERLPGSSAGSVLQNGNGAVHSSNGVRKEPAALGPLKRKHEVSFAVSCFHSSPGEQSIPQAHTYDTEEMTEHHQMMKPTQHIYNRCPICT